MFHCPVGVWVIEQHAIILSATVRSPTMIKLHTVYAQSQTYIFNSSRPSDAYMRQ